MAQAYDFALDKMGLDIQSFSLWSDYIKFLKVQIALFITSSLILPDFWPSSEPLLSLSWQGVDAVGNFAENQKIAAIRKVNNE